MLQSARLNSVQKGYKDNPIWERYGPTFFTSMFVSLRGVNYLMIEIVVEVRYNDPGIGMIHQDYLVTRSNISIRIEVSPLH